MASRSDALTTRAAATSEGPRSGWAKGPDAVARAILGATARLAGAPPALVLVFPDASTAPRDVAAQLAAAPPGCAVAGMACETAIADASARSGGCVAIAFPDTFAAGVGVAERASRDLRDAGRTAARAAVAAVEPLDGGLVVLLFVDPAAGDQADAVGGAYEAVGGTVPLAGGGVDGPAAALIAGREVISDAVVAVAVSSPRPIGVGFAHGCDLSGAPAIATRTDGRTVRELNGRPAEDVYLEALHREGTPLDDAAFERLAVLHPLAQLELRGDLRVRHVLGRAAGGGLACATTIPANAGVWLTEQTSEAIIDSTRDAVRAALEPLRGPARAALVFDCAARRRALGDRVAEEPAVLSSALDGAPVAGAYTRGEIGRTRGAKGDRNHVVVVVAFG